MATERLKPCAPGSPKGTRKVQRHHPGNRNKLAMPFAIALEWCHWAGGTMAALGAGEEPEIRLLAYQRRAVKRILQDLIRQRRSQNKQTHPSTKIASHRIAHEEEMLESTRSRE